MGVWLSIGSASIGVNAMANKAVYVDCDETIVMSNLSDYPEDQHVVIDYINGPIKVVLNQKNINLTMLFYKLGYDVYCWSKTGADWAELVSKRSGLSVVVKNCLPKPDFYIDDKEASYWMGPRRWRSNLKEEEV